MLVKVKLNDNYRQLVQQAMLSTMNITELVEPEEYARRMSKPMSDKLFRSLLVAQHSPIKRCRIEIQAVMPNRVMTHITRHHDTLHFVGTSRPDITYSAELPDGMRQLTMDYDAKRLIEICKLRLCGKAWHETIELFEEVKLQLIDLEPCFDGMLNPTCVWLGFCNEKCCGFNKTDEYCQARRELVDWRIR